MQHELVTLICDKSVNPNSQKEEEVCNDDLYKSADIVSFMHCVSTASAEEGVPAKHAGQFVWKHV